MASVARAACQSPQSTGTDADEWVEYATPDRRRYYWNRRTKQTSWSLPSPLQAAAWVGQVNEDTKETYYWNKTTRETYWTLPPLKSEACTNESSKLSSSEPLRPDPCTADVHAPTLDFAPSMPPEEEAWVEVIDGGTPYFWNICTLTVNDRLPANVAQRGAMWQAHRTKDGRPYFCKRRRDGGLEPSVWSVLGESSRGPTVDFSSALTTADGDWVEHGAVVCILGLACHARFNGQAGELLDADGHRCYVRLPDALGGPVLAVKPCNLGPLPQGSLVELRGLSQQSGAASLNGQVGTCEGRDGDARRYSVKLSDGTLKNVKPINLIARCRLWDLNPGLQAEQLQNGAAQACLFVDSSGQHRRYRLRLPAGFSLRPPPGEDEPGRWPVLVYLPGVDGHGFFAWGERAMRMPGLTLAARRFVVVSPACDWSSHKSGGPLGCGPPSWCAELVRALRAACWVDPGRIYLTGCGPEAGTGALELAAIAPDLFAAVAPVQARHRPEFAQELVRRLRGTSILALHQTSPGEDPELALWSQFSESSEFQVKSLRGSSSSVHEEAYWSEHSLYEWFLQSRSGAC